MLNRIPKRLRRWVLGAAGSLVALASFVFALLWFCFPFPAERLDSQSTSPQVTDCSGRVLLQVVSDDDQWMFPVSLEEVSPWLVKATIAAEDERFYSHGGVDLVAAGRASLQGAGLSCAFFGGSEFFFSLAAWNNCVYILRGPWGPN